MSWVPEHDIVEELRQKEKVYYLYGNLLPTPKYHNTAKLAKKAMTWWKLNRKNNSNSLSEVLVKQPMLKCCQFEAAAFKSQTFL